MNTYNLILSVLLHLLLLAHTTECGGLRKLPLLKALRANGLGAYADFLERYPTPEMNNPNIIVFAPSNKAVKAYEAAHPTPEPGTIHRRQSDASNSAANQNNIASGAAVSVSLATLPAQGIVFASGAGGTSGTKVASSPAAAGGGGSSSGSGSSSSRRTRNINLDERTLGPQTPLAVIAAGGGERTNVLRDAIVFDNDPRGYDRSLIYEVDSFFNPTGDFGTAITGPSGFNLTYLVQIFDRIPTALEKLLGAEKITFLAPTQEAFDKTGLNACTSKTRLLQEFLDNHTITSGFLGYTPSFVNGQVYTTDGGTRFVPEFNGTNTFLNNALIVGQNHIVNAGVIQIIDHVLYRPTWNNKCRDNTPLPREHK